MQPKPNQKTENLILGILLIFSLGCMLTAAGGCSAPFFSANTVDQVCSYAREACDIWDTLWVYDTTEISFYYADCMPSGRPYTVYFGENSAEIPDSLEDVLCEALSVMDICETADMMITGHCDDRLSEEYNDSLGWERAKSVRNWFVERGIANFRIMTLSRGEIDFLAKAYYDLESEFAIYNAANNMRQEIWRLNRRAEIKILK